MSSLDRWGPFADGLEPGERLARLRSLRALVRVLCGPRGVLVQETLRKAETRPDAAASAQAELMAMAPVDWRKELASYAALNEVCKK